MNTSHLVALTSHLINERARLRAATCLKETELRTVWVRQIEREINSEEIRLGMSVTDFDAQEMSIEEILSELDA